MDFKTIINSLGIVISTLGVYIVYKYSPINEDVIDGGQADTDFAKIVMRTAKRNNNIKKGVYLIILGSLLQLMSNFVPSAGCSCC